tara:strand:- start:11 stop:226 length:216 start_codon:yes stop_codon:yes gene_type:complete
VSYAVLQIMETAVIYLAEGITQPDGMRAIVFSSVTLVILNTTFSLIITTIGIWKSSEKINLMNSILNTNKE